MTPEKWIALKARIKDELDVAKERLAHLDSLEHFRRIQGGILMCENVLSLMHFLEQESTEEDLDN